MRACTRWQEEGVLELSPEEKRNRDNLAIHRRRQATDPEYRQKRRERFQKWMKDPLNKKLKKAYNAWWAAEHLETKQIAREIFEELDVKLTQGARYFFADSLTKLKKFNRKFL